VQPSKRHGSTIEGKNYNVLGGYHNVTGGGRSKKKKIVHNQMAPGFERDELSAIDKDFIEGAQWQYSFDCPRSSMVTHVDYDPKRLLMRVEFVNRGDIVVYDHVPAETFFYLKHNAERDGHIGKVFWDVVRYRGQLVGSKFPFWYENKSSYFDDPGFKSLPPEVQEQVAQVNQAGRKEATRDAKAKLMFEREGGLVDTPTPSINDFEEIRNIDESIAAEASAANEQKSKTYSQQLTERMARTLETAEEGGIDEVTGLPMAIGAYSRQRMRRSLWKRQDGLYDESIKLPKNMRVGTDAHGNTTLEIGKYTPNKPAWGNPREYPGLTSDESRQIAEERRQYPDLKR
jgi:hypothetical protein